MTDIILKAEHLKKVFISGKKSMTAVDDVSFGLERGECLGIVGESGSGKSTIARMLTHLEPVTDGQIFLESDLFFSGMRPAVNVGLSVSRVGGAAQTKAMKKASGSVRIDLAQYREMEVFTQFSSDLDEATTAQLKYGSCLMELLKQPLCSPLSLHQQVITLCVATHKLMVDVEKKEIKKYQKDLLEYFDNVYPEIGKEIETTKQLSDELVEKIVKAAEEFRDKSR